MCNKICHHRNCNSHLNKKQNKFCSLSCSTAEKNISKSDSNIKNYELNPTRCNFCNNALSYEKKNNLFCSKSCSASFNNKLREKSHKECNNCKTLFSPKRKNNEYCSLECFYSFSKNKTREKFNKGLLTERATIKKYVIERDGYKCSSCHITEWNNKSISLHLDHINGDPSDNESSNFRLLCPNCHSQTDTYGAKNKGFGRKSKGISLR